MYLTLNAMQNFLYLIFARNGPENGPKILTLFEISLV